MIRLMQWYRLSWITRRELLRSDIPQLSFRFILIGEQAESVEESEKNVAFGYLSVLLGYFSLLPEISERIKNNLARKTLRPLVASIEEFIGFNKTVDDLIAPDEDGHNPHSVLTERLENLVTKLGAFKGLGK
jgi:hypothetical protein